MDPSNKEVSAVPLSSPVEQLASGMSGAPGETAPAGGEQAVMAAERAPASDVSPPAQTGGIIPLPLPNPLPAVAAAAGVQPIQSSALAADDDKDLIEKEWVDKAKQIVERNRNDPYKQSEELTVFKADYLKKRYGKTIKVSQ